MSRGIAIWLAAAGCALTVAGCGGGESSENQAAEPRIPAQVSEQLAAEADRVADLLAEGRVCEAAQQADVLNRAVSEASGRIPDSLEAELVVVAQELVDNVNCPDPVEDEEKDEKKEDKDKGEGKENGNGKGNGGEGEDGETLGTTTVIDG